MKSMRTFISIDVDNDKLVKLQKELDETGANLKLVEPQNIHLTLKFLGEVKESMINEIGKTMEKSVEGIHPFKANLKGIGVFPSEKYMRIIWVGLLAKEIMEISSRIEDRLGQLGFKREKRAFTPHVTIARVKSARNKDKLLSSIKKYCDEDFGWIGVNFIKLKKSKLTPRGPLYENLIDVKLA
jgi:2'-5' RNA ligase